MLKSNHFACASNNSVLVALSVVVLMAFVTSCDPIKQIGPLVPPEKVAAILDEGQEFAKVNWNSVVEVNNYIVYKKVGTSDYFPISRLVSGTEFKDYNPNTDEIFYKISSERNGEYSGLSNPSNSVKCVYVTAPPKNIILETIGTQVKISWTAPDAQTYQYQVYRQVGSLSWEAIGSRTNTGILTYTDTNPPLDKTLYYGVKSYSISEKQYSEMATAGPIVVTLYLTKPIVESFTIANGIYIHWSEDTRAQDYILYRDDGNTATPDVVVYTGTALEYTDYAITSNQFYYYKLGIRKAGQVICSSQYASGMGYHEIRDIFEPNDTIENATTLHADLNSANIYYYIDNQGERLLDEDWYFLTLPANFEATITFQGLTNISSGELFFQENGKEIFPITEGDSFFIENNGAAEANIYFRVYVNLSSFETNKLGKYQIKVE